MITATVGLGAVLALAIVVSGPPFEISIGVANVVAAVAGCVLLALAFGGIALAVGAGRGAVRSPSASRRVSRQART